MRININIFARQRPDYFGIPAVIFSLFIISSCLRKPDNPGQLHQSLPFDSTAGYLIADTIIYDVIINVDDPNDQWKIESLGRLRKDEFVNLIFDMAYNGGGICIDYNTGEIITGNDIQKLEKELDNNRDIIGMVQFSEVWYINPVSGSMTKKVHSVILGYEFYSTDNFLLGHKPLFKFVFNNM